MNQIVNGKRTFNRSGFTLTELLVVIAIIGILAAMLFPAMQGALLSAKASKAGNQAAGYGKLLFSGSIDADSAGYNQLYPTTDDNYANTEDYIVASISNGVQDIDFTFFSLPGNFAKSLAGIYTNESVQTAFKAGGYCGWCIVEDIDTESNPNLPFMFTANINVTEDTGQLTDENNPLYDKATVDMLGNKMAIVIGSQGSVKIFKDPKYLKNDTFNPSGEAFTYLKPVKLQ